jgi:hypothetical protein
VVLTAGHCIGEATDWNVTAPYAGGGQTAHGSSGAVFDYSMNASTVIPTEHDVGLIFLDTPIALDVYPGIVSQPLAFGSQVVNVGRIQNGAFSTTDLFVGPLVTVSDGATIGYPFDYSAPDIIESGDSGGPVEIQGAHVIVAVNSGGGQVEVLARVDLVYSWIQQQIQANSGDGGVPEGEDAGADANTYGSQYASSPGESGDSLPTENAPASRPAGCSVGGGARPFALDGLVVALVLLATARRRRAPATRAGA